MWRYKPFMPKEQTGLEGRTIDIGNLKVHVRNVIAEGGFSCVYLARDAINGSKQYAVKHIICNDEESLELVMKEISVMKLLRGHPNIVMLYAHTILNMGRTNEALLIMEYCEKSLVNVLERREAGYFGEKQILSIFRDVCSAVFAMHCQSPPIAHRDLKAENLLLGSDGLWKLCDFGSTSTNHKRFEKPEEMGIEEDNIRKHTTPAYRAPEMWDLFRKELLNEKVDIWALGCLLFRISYLKSAFDGESKLQILNGNYQIPELPKYCSDVTDLIRDMLESSPIDRPDITQVWFRVNGLLPDGLQKSLPDSPPEMQQHGTDTREEDNPRPKNRTCPVPHRSLPPLPISKPCQNMSRLSGWGPIVSFWTAQDENDSVVAGDEMKPKFGEEPSRHDKSHPERPVQKFLYGTSVNRSADSPSKNFEIDFFQNNSDSVPEMLRTLKFENSPAFQTDVEFNTNNIKKSGKEELLEAEVERLKEQQKQTNVDKAEVTSKYEKLSAICRSQQRELEELKQALDSRTPSPNIKASKTQTSHGIQLSSMPPQQQRNKNSSSPGAKPWQPFADDPNLQTSLMNNSLKSVRTRNGHHNEQAAEVASGANTWDFETDSFRASLAASSQISLPVTTLNKSQRFGDSMNIGNKSASQPAGWAGF